MRISDWSSDVCSSYLMPRRAILPSGKTNALALDLGVPLDWAVADVVEAAVRGQFVRRAPIEIYRDGADQPDVRGFLFGAGAFVRATKVAQRTHRFGAFNGLAEIGRASCRERVCQYV